MSSSKSCVPNDSPLDLGKSRRAKEAALVGIREASKRFLETSDSESDDERTEMQPQPKRRRKLGRSAAPRPRSPSADSLGSVHSEDSLIIRDSMFHFLMQESKKAAKKGAALLEREAKDKDIMIGADEQVSRPQSSVSPMAMAAGADLASIGSSAAPETPEQLLKQGFSLSFPENSGGERRAVHLPSTLLPRFSRQELALLASETNGGIHAKLESPFWGSNIFKTDLDPRKPLSIFVNEYFVSDIVAYANTEPKRLEVIGDMVRVAFAFSELARVCPCMFTSLPLCHLMSTLGKLVHKEPRLPSDILSHLVEQSLGMVPSPEQLESLSVVVPHVFLAGFGHPGVVGVFSLSEIIETPALVRQHLGHENGIVDTLLIDGTALSLSVLDAPHEMKRVAQAVRTVVALAKSTNIGVMVKGDLARCSEIAERNFRARSSMAGVVLASVTARSVDSRLDLNMREGRSWFKRFSICALHFVAEPCAGNSAARLHSTLFDSALEANVSPPWMQAIFSKFEHRNGKFVLTVPSAPSHLEMCWLRGIQPAGVLGSERFHILAPPPATHEEHHEFLVVSGRVDEHLRIHDVWPFYKSADGVPKGYFSGLWILEFVDRIHLSNTA